jgi:hypothetical protein
MWRIQDWRVRNMEDTGMETLEVEEIGRESEKCGGYREEKGGSGGYGEAKVWKWSLQEGIVLKDTGREREQGTGEDTGRDRERQGEMWRIQGGRVRNAEDTGRER